MTHEPHRRRRAPPMGTGVGGILEDGGSTSASGATSTPASLLIGGSIDYVELYLFGKQKLIAEACHAVPKVTYVSPAGLTVLKTAATPGSGLTTAPPLPLAPTHLA